MQQSQNPQFSPGQTQQIQQGNFPQFPRGQSQQVQPGQPQTFPPGQAQQLPPGQPQQFPSGQPQQFPPGQPQQFPLGQPQQFPPGQPQQFQPGQPQTFPPGQSQQFPLGQPQPFPSGQTQQFPPSQPQQFSPPSQPQQFPPPSQPQQFSPDQTPQFPLEQSPQYPFEQPQQTLRRQLQPFQIGQEGEYQPGQSFSQPMPGFYYSSPTDAAQAQFAPRSLVVSGKESIGIQTPSKHHCESKKSIKCVSICTCCAQKSGYNARMMEECEEEREPPRYGEAICAHTFCVLERAKYRPIGLPWASGLFNHQQRTLPECEPCYEPARIHKKKKKYTPIPICQPRGPTYTTDQMMAFLKLLLLAIEITDEKEDKKYKDEQGKTGDGKSREKTKRNQDEKSIHSN